MQKNLDAGSGDAILATMRIVTLVAVCLLTACASTPPPTPAPVKRPVAKAPTDPLGHFLTEKGLIDQLSAQIERSRDTLGPKASDLVIGAMGYLGVPYQRGGNRFDEGFDCSGFVRALFEQSAGLSLPRKAEQQAAATQEIDPSELRPGDLVFYNTSRRAYSHVGLYVGNEKFIHSPTPGSVIRLEDMRLAYWQKRFDGARRVPAIQPENTAAYSGSDGWTAR